ncbi:TniQ family protein [Glaciecola sp. MF2-115]|uniref:TniQ family protein n=1 Tax=Glaciecola sp. MF2-115 TaxID=3384827 RepID=UPI0039A081BA
MPKVFRINLKPEVGELFKGFLLRLAKENGFMTIKEMFSAIGMVYTSSCFKRTSKMHKDLFSTLAPMLNFKVDSLQQCFESLNFFEIENKDASLSIQTNTPSVCIKCLKDSGFIRENWQQYHVTYCKFHSGELNTHCPSCAERLSWNADIFSGCNRCGYRWCEHVLQLSEEPEHLRFIEKLTGRKEETIFLSSLYKAFCELAQPYSFAPTKVDFNQYNNSELSNQFTHAFQLITSKASMLLFTESIHSKLANTMQFVSFELLKKLEHPIKNIRPNFFQYDTANNRALMTTKMGKTLITEVQVGRLLGIPPVTVRSLSKLGQFSSINYNRSRQYDLYEIDSFMLTWSKRASPIQADEIHLLSSLTTLHTMSVKHLQSEAEALNSLLKSNLSVYVAPAAKNLNDFYVDRNDFLALISTQYDDVTSHLLSYTELGEYLCTNRLKVSEYAEAFGWKPVLTSRNVKKFDRQDVYETMESHIFLDRWCGFKPYPKNGLDTYLQQHGLRPVLSARKGTSLHVYIKSSKLIELIELYEQLWLQLQPPNIVRERCKNKNIPFVQINNKLLMHDFQLYPYPA